MTQFFGFARKGVCNREKRMQLFTGFFLRAKTRMRGRTYVLPEEFLLAGCAGSGDKLPQLSLAPEWALPRGGKNIFFKS